jgi:adenosylcobinamide kinase/adenosylcobinamide-phosphate guanylyltransferase
MRELILGGQKSGKSRFAQERARGWLAQSASHEAVLLATGLAHDEEMRQRIARHQADRRSDLPALRCLEESRDLGARLRELSKPQTLVIIDCLTLWLTQLLMPSQQEILKKNHALASIDYAQSATEFIAYLLHALPAAPGPVVLVSNEIGLGVIPLGREVRQFVDELGRLNQAVAAQCERVTFMAAGCAMTLKEAA